MHELQISEIYGCGGSEDVANPDENDSISFPFLPCQTSSVCYFKGRSQPRSFPHTNIATPIIVCGCSMQLETEGIEARSRDTLSTSTRILVVTDDIMAFAV